MFNWLPVWFTKYYYGGNNSRGDWLEGSDNYADTMYGYGGNDTFYSSLGPDTFYGGSGVDTVDYSKSAAGQDLGYRGSEGVTVNLATGIGSGSDAAGDRYNSIENVRGSNFNDHITGNGANNVLKGGDGMDTLYGGNGNDRLLGEDGRDQLYGGSGDDKLFGGASDDHLLGSSGNDDLFGGSGRDTFQVESGQDDYFGGTGTDELHVYENDVRIDLQAGRGFGGNAEGDTYNSIEELVMFGSANVEIQGASASESFSVMQYTSNVQISAGDGDDKVYFHGDRSSRFEGNESSFFDGGSGTDTLDVYSRSDLVIDMEYGEFYLNSNEDDRIGFENFENAKGRGGNDTFIDASEANNSYTGGGGNDIFLFTHEDDDGTIEVDVITDFSSGEDKIDLGGTEVDDWNYLTNNNEGYDVMFDTSEGVVIRTTDSNNNRSFDRILLEDVSVSDLSENDFIF